MKFYLLFRVNFPYSKVFFYYIRLNLSRVNFHGALISHNKVIVIPTAHSALQIILLNYQDPDLQYNTTINSIQ